MLVIIIIGRWLLPKGDLSRDQLSSLLLNYTAMASDIVDFFTILDEDEKLTDNWMFVYSVLAFWTLSLLQFAFVHTVQKQDEEDDNHDEDDDAAASEKQSDDNHSVLGRLKKNCQMLLATEAWAICLTIFLQDLPFLIVRLLAVIKYNVFTQSNTFFICKNSLVLCLQSYRLFALFKEHREKKMRKEEQRNKHLMNALYKWAFVYGKMKSKRGPTGEDNPGSRITLGTVEKSGVDYHEAKTLKEAKYNFVF